MNGIIALICNKYVVLNQMMKINRNSLYDMLLPGDNVEYNIIDNMINITKITSRKTQYLLAIVKKIENNQAILFCPNYPKFFEPKIMNNNYKLNNMMIIEITLDNINVIIIYDSIKNRIHDKDIILMLYKLNATTDIKLEYNINNNNNVTSNVTSNNIIDLSHLDSFNVDPTNSKDFDDAISINENKIYVHIVDGNHMIQPNTTEDYNAFIHSFTLYTPEHIENILPKDMAENKLSLIKDMKRHVITIEFNININDMSINDMSIYRSIIVIKNRYDYNNFNVDMYPLLKTFYEKWKRNTLDIPHIKFDINKMGHIEKYYYEHNTDINHKIIETLMILTNMTISKHITIPQRYHMKLKHELKCENITGNDIIDNILTVKRYRNASYSNNNNGHFGLQLDSYTHFTSPIRRYFDIIVHRMLAGITYENLDIILEYINTRERYIDNIVKLYNNLKLYSYMDSMIDTIYEAYIINIMDNGITCMIKDFLYEVFIFTKNKYNIGEMAKVKISIVWGTMEIKAKIK